MTTSSFTGGFRQTTQPGQEGTSQVSGHGSILHQFITDGVEEEEDNDGDICRLPAGMVSIKSLNSQ